MSPSQKTPLKRIPKIVLTGGGSGGHITPLLSLARALKNQRPDCRITYIGQKGDRSDELRGQFEIFDDVRYIRAGKFRRYHGESWLKHLLDVKTLLLNGRDFFLVLVGLAESLKLISKLNPDLVLLKGGYVGLPVGLAAKLRRTAIITHDSDAIEGLANRLAGRWALVHAVGFPKGEYRYPAKTVRFTGTPLDERVKEFTSAEKADLKRELGLPRDRPVLLVAGGGLGAETINNLMIKIAPRLLKSMPDLNIIHLAGSRNEASLRQAYGAVLDEEQHRQLQLEGFVTDFYRYAGAADVVITRAGATTLAELAVQAKACIVIPSPFLAGGHQLKNARVLKEQQAAVVLDNSVAPDELLRAAHDLLKDEERRRRLGRKIAKTAKPDASAELAGLILETADKSGRAKGGR